MPGHSRPKDGVASARLCPGHPRSLCVKAWMGRSSPGMTTNAKVPRRGVRKTVALELVGQCGFQDLSGRSMRDAFDEDDVVRHPPFRDLAVHELQDLLAARLRARLELHDQERALVPFRMVHADHGG